MGLRQPVRSIISSHRRRRNWQVISERLGVGNRIKLRAKSSENKEEELDEMQILMGRKYA